MEIMKGKAWAPKGAEMSPDRFRELLDAWLEDGLGEGELEELRSMAASQNEYAGQLEAAQLYRDVLKGLEAEPAVPLAAQAAWRRAVREERRQQRFKGLRRALAGIAAACLITVGVFAAFRTAGGPRVMTRIEADGLEDVPEATDAVGVGDYAQITLRVEAADEALDRLKDIVAEYGAEVDWTERSGDEERVYLTVPAADDEAFVCALSGIGEVEGQAGSGRYCIAISEE